jgi:tetrapyrrole methylase family protein/MazG family protein
MDKLLSDSGCPWDRIQTHESLRQYLLEESYEAIDAINNNDMAALCEELGDVLLEVVFHSKIAEKLNQFTIDDVVDGIANKMINRHRHIFGDVKADSPEEVLISWDKIKDEEKGYRNKTDKMRSVPKALPSLTRAEKVLKRSEQGVGFTDSDAENISELLKGILIRASEKNKNSEINETEIIEEQIGSLLIYVVQICRFFNINPEFALTNALETYITRFENRENPVNSGFAAIINE